MQDTREKEERNDGEEEYMLGQERIAVRSKEVDDK